VAVRGTAFEAGGCIVAVDVASGRVDWVTGPGRGGFGVIADGSTVLAATGGLVGGAGGALSAELINGLVAYDPGTGVERWHVALPVDGQQLPAVLTGGVVVVSEAGGALLGLSEQDGHRLWSDSPPAGCVNGFLEDLQPDAKVIGPGPVRGSDATAAVAYGCPGGGGVDEVDAATGTLLWAWPVPEGWVVDQQQAVTVTAGLPGGDVVAGPIDLMGSAVAPPVTAPAPGPSRSTNIGNVMGDSADNDVVMLDAATGQPRWDLEGLPGQALAVVSGAGSLCVVTDAGADCRAALDGAPRWSIYWPGRNASSTYPPLTCVDLGAALGQPCVVSKGGRMYVVTATDSAPAYPPQPGPPMAAGAFVLSALDMATGRALASLTLPSFANPGTDHAVSIGLPPGVLLAADGLVLVSPQFDETGVVETFTAPASN
jgi:outer membrane protein assembly factor BamB